MNPQTPDNEVEKLREEANNWHQHYRDEAFKAQKCKQAYIEQEKEVARLRELLNRAIEIADEFWKNQKQAVTIWHGELADELYSIRDEIQKLKNN